MCYKPHNGLRGLWCSVACTLYKHPLARYRDLVSVIQTNLRFSGCAPEKRRYCAAIRSQIFRLSAIGVFKSAFSFYSYNIIKLLLNVFSY